MTAPDDGAGAPAIEITPAMIDARVRMLRRYYGEPGEPESRARVAVTRIFEAMADATRPGESQPQSQCEPGAQVLPFER